MFAGYDPTRDPMSPLYNPFALPSSGTSPNTGGFDVAQGFANGGIATIAPQRFATGGKVTPPTYGAKMKPTKQTELYQRQRAAEQRQYQTALAGSVSNYNSRMGTTPPKTQAQLFREAEASRLSKQRIEKRAEDERNARIQAQVNMAMKAGREGRAFEFAPGYENERNLYAQAIAARKEARPTSFMTPDQAEAYVARQRADNLAAERAKFDQDQAAAVARAKAQQDALAAKAKADKELADFEAYKASILGPGGSTQPVTPGGSTQPVTPGGSTPPTTGPAPTIPSAPIQDIGIGAPGGTIMPPTTGPAPTAPGIPEINVGGGSALPSITQPPVYGPDGTQYPSASAAITAGVYNYSMTPPSTGGISTLPSFGGVDFGSGSATSPTNTLSSFGTGSTADAFGTGSTADAFGTGSTADAFGSQTTSGLPAFANGGIAAMAPYKFSRGSSPVQHYPRRTGPINGPGTGKSDSIPAMLSDGEFVFTAKAVRGMGNGSRLQGAKKMYKMMKMLEGKG
jgi:hypothetical protein